MSSPGTMTVIEITRPGGPDVLQPATRPVPRPARGEVLIRVQAAGVNRPDLAQRAGTYPPPPGASDLPGLEVAGEVAALGPGVSGIAIGAKVAALTPGGGYAEFCLTQASHCLPWPKGYDAVRAAALPETFFTVWTNLFDRAGLKPGERVLIHGGASGIGTTAIQLARQHGAKVAVTAGGPAKLAACERLGAELAINYREEDFVAAIREWHKDGVDVVLDMIGGDYFNRNLQVLALNGRLVQIAFMNGHEVQANLRPIMLKRLHITGSTLRPRSVEDKAAIATSLRRTVWPWLDQGLVAPQIYKTFALTEAAKAHAELEAGDHVGKIVLVAQ